MTSRFWVLCVCAALIAQISYGSTHVQQQLTTVSEAHLNVSVTRLVLAGIPGLNTEEFEVEVQRMATRSADRCGVCLNDSATQKLWVMVTDTERAEGLLAVGLKVELLEPAILERHARDRADQATSTVVSVWQAENLILVEEDQVARESLEAVSALLDELFESIGSARAFAKLPVRGECLDEEVDD